MVISVGWRGRVLRRTASTLRSGSRTLPYVKRDLGLFEHTALASCARLGTCTPRDQGSELASGGFRDLSLHHCIVWRSPKGDRLRLELCPGGGAQPAPRRSRGHSRARGPASQGSTVS